MPGPDDLPRGFGGSPQVRHYEAGDAETWDAFVGRAWNGTLLHTRRYLSYHGDRFEDRSLIVEDAGDIVGLLPAAVDPDDPAHVVSHPGLTYGGLLSAGQLRGEAAIRSFQACLATFREHGHARFTYKTIPSILHRLPYEDDLYALWRLGASIERSDLWAWIPAGRPQPLSYDRRRAVRRAAAASVRVDRGPERLPEFWAALTENLRSRHGVSPVHSLAEITTLIERFPEAIEFFSAVQPEGALLAGALTFRTPGAVHIQYSSPTASGRAVGALDAVYEHITAGAAEQGLATSFGASTEAGGQVLNTPLYYFKASFGAASLTHQFLSLRLGPAGL